jgi:hypothetical protein
LALAILARDADKPLALRGSLNPITAARLTFIRHV